MTPNEIRAIRGDKSQEWLARALGLDNRSTVCRWENGKRKPSRLSIIALQALERKLKKKVAQRQHRC